MFINLNNAVYWFIWTIIGSMAKDLPATIDLNKWIDSMAIAMTRNVFSAIDQHAGDKGIEVQKSLALSLISRVLSGVVMATLQHRPEELKTKRALSDYNINAFTEIKVATQEAIAEAFTLAMSQYSGINTEYYCTLKIVPPAPSKEFQ